MKKIRIENVNVRNVHAMREVLADHGYKGAGKWVDDITVEIAYRPEEAQEITDLAADLHEQGITTLRNLNPED